MSESTQATLDLNALRESVCVQTNKITDAYRDKDCIEDLRVYLTKSSQAALECATGARARYAELLHVSIAVGTVPFHRGHYSVDLTYYYRILADALMGNARPTPIFGLAVFSKRIVMFGGETAAKRFKSTADPGNMYGTQPEQIAPEVILEAVDPMILSAKITDACCCRCDVEPTSLPEGIFSCFDEELVLNGDGKRLYVTLGQFSIIRMQRETQLYLPVFDYELPSKEFNDSLPGNDESDPCEVFSQIEFPVDSFSPAGSGNQA